MDADGNRRYNSARSAFWRVTRRTLQGISGEPELSDWSSRLAWANLYKVAPAAGGNPTSRLIEAQHPLAERLLKQEIHHCAPKHVLVLTGRHWFDRFADALGFCEISSLARGYVQRVGRIPLSSGVACVVVTPHPQGKREEQLVTDVLGAFKQLRMQVAQK